MIAVLAIAPLVACGDTDSDDTGSTDTAVAAAPATDSATTEPASTEPATTEPATTEPATTEIAITDPASTDHVTTDHTDADHVHDDEDDDSVTVDTDGDSDYLGSYALVDEGFGTITTVVVDQVTRTIDTNALPDHETGEFPNGGNPNTITAQDLTWEFPSTGEYTGDVTAVRTSGVAVNGVKFEPGTAETLACASGETYRIEALQDVYGLGFDMNNAHVQPTGEYHYHGISELLVDAYDSGDDLVHVGFAADGFLMYYSLSAAYTSGWELDTDTRTGTECVASGPDGTTIDVEGSVADGTYSADWIFADSGDLDECNGTTIDGEYAYVVTDTYPFVSRCLNGEVSGEAGGAPQGGAEGAAAPSGDQGGTPLSAG